MSRDPRFPARNSCAPVALAKLLTLPFDTVCTRIIEAGGNYQAVTKEIFRKILPVKTEQLFDNPMGFHEWVRGKRGRWVTVVTGLGAETGHCVTLRRGDYGKPLDNHWIWEGGQERMQSLKIHAAWQLATGGEQR